MPSAPTCSLQCTPQHSALASNYMLHLPAHYPVQAQVSEEQMLPPEVLCTAQANMLQAAWTIVQCRQKHNIRPIVSQASSLDVPACLCH